MLTDELRIGESNHGNNVIFWIHEVNLKYVILSGFMAKDLVFAVKAVYANMRKAYPSQKRLGMTVFISGGFRAFLLQMPRQL